MFGTLLSHSVSHSLEREALAELLDEKLAWEPANPSCPPLSAPLSSEVVCEVMPNFLLGFWYLNSGPHACMLAQQVLLSTVLACFQKPLVEEHVFFILQLTIHHPEKPRQELQVETEAGRNTASCLLPLLARSAAFLVEHRLTA